MPADRKRFTRVVIIERIVVETCVGRKVGMGSRSLVYYARRLAIIDSLIDAGGNEMKMM